MTDILADNSSPLQLMTDGDFGVDSVNSSFVHTPVDKQIVYDGDNVEIDVNC
jgi:hypothetical protein